MVKNLPANTVDAGLICDLGRPTGEGNGNPLQYSCQGNPMDKGARQATAHGVTRVRYNLATKQKQLEREESWKCFQRSFTKEAIIGS